MHEYDVNINLLGKEFRVKGLWASSAKEANDKAKKFLMGKMEGSPELKNLSDNHIYNYLKDILNGKG